MNPFIYKATVERVVDGDTIDVMLDLGFSIYQKGRVRLTGIDTPESRTRDKVEKKYGLAAKQFLVDWVAKYPYILVESSEKGKFGRILGRLYDPDKTECWNDMAIESYHAVPYQGQSKDDIKLAHLENRKRLTESGFVI
jgi:micrococcal nuclease